MDKEKIIEEINETKRKILLDLSTFELVGLIRDEVLKIKEKINRIQPDKNMKLIELLEMKEYLEVIQSTDISLIDRKLNENKDANKMFDNSTEELNNDFESLKKEIVELINYLKEKFSSIGLILEEKYKKEIANFYSDFEKAKNVSRRSFSTSIGANTGFELAIYPDTKSVLEVYIRRLSEMKTSLKTLENIAEKNKIIESLFANALIEYDNDEQIKNAIERVKENYDNNIEKLLNEVTGKTTNFILYSQIDKLQDEVLSGIQNVSTLAKEIKRPDEYFDYLENLSFENIDYDLLLEIEKFVYEKNTLFDEFIRAIYFIVEKEKYEKKYQNKDFRLYDRLDKRTKDELERIFVDRLKQMQIDDLPNFIRNYRQNGYLNTIDNQYFEYFENSAYEESTKIEIKEKFDDEDIESKDNKDKSNELFKIERIKRKMILSLKETNKEIYSCKEISAITHLKDNIYYVHTIENKNNEHFLILFDDKGNIIKKLKDFIYIKTFKDMPRLYFFESRNIYDNSNCLFDNNFNLIGKVLSYYWIITDPKKDEFAFGDRIARRIFVYNNKNEIIKEYTWDSEDERLSSHLAFNDGLMPMLRYATFDFNLKKFTIKYLDIEGNTIIPPQTFTIKNLKQIDVIKALGSSHFAFSDERAISYSNEGKHMGYIDTSGNVVIPKIYKNARPFYNGVAIVTTDDNKDLLIDKYGNELTKEIESVVDDYTEIILGKAGKAVGKNDDQDYYQIIYYKGNMSDLSSYKVRAKYNFKEYKDKRTINEILESLNGYKNKIKKKEEWHYGNK